MLDIVYLILAIVLVCVYGVYMVYNIKTQKETKYKYHCTQPDIARTNNCGYLGFDGKCLMPYEGCNHQRMENEM